MGVLLSRERTPMWNWGPKAFTISPFPDVERQSGLTKNKVPTPVSPHLPNWMNNCFTTSILDLGPLASEPHISDVSDGFEKTNGSESRTVKGREQRYINPRYVWSSGETVQSLRRQRKKGAGTRRPEPRTDRPDEIPRVGGTPARCDPV